VLKPVTVVFRFDVSVMIAVPGLPALADHVPVPTAERAIEPPGKTAQASVLSGPASGL